MQRPRMGALSDDLAWFETQRGALAQQYPGQWLLIKDKQVQGAYPDYGSAFTAGTAKFGTQPFAIKQALAQQPVHHVAALSDDLAWFEANRGYISAQYPNKYVVIKDKQVVGAYPDYGSAFTAGTAMFGTQPFAVKQATAQQEVKHAAYRSVERAPWRPIAIGQAAPPAAQQPAAPAAPGVVGPDALKANGALVTVILSTPKSHAAQAANQGGGPGGAPQTVKGMIDTGASISTVSPQVAAAAGLVQTGTVPLSGVGGGGEDPVYAASMTLPDFNITVDPIEIGGVGLPMPGVDMLVGRDILAHNLQLSFHGGQGAFSLATDSPAVTSQPGQAAPTQPGAPTGEPAPEEGLSTGAKIAIGGGVLVATVGALFAFKII